MTSYYYIDGQGKQVGPLSLESLKSLGLAPGTPVWREGMAEWSKAELLPELDIQARAKGRYNSAEQMNAGRSGNTGGRNAGKGENGGGWSGRQAGEWGGASGRSGAASGQGGGVKFGALQAALVAFAVVGTVVLSVVGRFVSAFFASMLDVYPQIPSVILLVVMVVAVGLHAVFRKRRWLLETVLVAMPFIVSSVVTIIYYTSDYVGIYRDGRCLIEKRGGEGVLNRWGREVVPCMFDHLQVADFGNELVYYATLDGKEGVIDAQGGVIVPCAYDYVRRYLTTELLLVEQDDKLGLLRLDGTEVLPCEYDNFTPWNNSGLLKCVQGDLKGLVSEEGEVVLPCIYLFTKQDETGLTKINDGGWVDNDNKIRGGYWGVINEEGLMVLPCRYKKLTIYGSEIRGEDGEYIYYFDHDGRVKEQIKDWH